eukprot:gene23830-32217_t
MLSQAISKGVRSASMTRRNMSSWKDIFDTKNNIAEIRNKYFLNHTQGAADPTYLKKGFADKVVMAAGLTGLLIGTSNILYGLYSMSLGINKAK